MTVDSHAHLTLRFESYEVPKILGDAKNDGVDGVLIAGYCPMHYARTVSLLDMVGTGGGNLPAVAAMTGIHPHEADKYGKSEIDRFPEQLRRNDIIAIGECGLDFYRDYADRANQETTFRLQVEMSVFTGYPLAIHSRSAFEKTMEILDDYDLPDPPGVFHCYGYGPDELESILNKGFFVSFAGMLTYNNATDTQRAARLVPEDRWLVETDCPFMVPRKAKNRKVRRNEPRYVMETFEKICELKEIDQLSAREQSIRNTLECFPKLKLIESWYTLLDGDEGGPD